MRWSDQRDGRACLTGTTSTIPTIGALQAVGRSHCELPRGTARRQRTPGAVLETARGASDRAHAPAKMQPHQYVHEVEGVVAWQPAKKGKGRGDGTWPTKKPTAWGGYDVAQKPAAAAITFGDTDRSNEMCWGVDRWNMHREELSSRTSTSVDSRASEEQRGNGEKAKQPRRPPRQPPQGRQRFYWLLAHWSHVEDTGCDESLQSLLALRENCRRG